MNCGPVCFFPPKQSLISTPTLYKEQGRAAVTLGPPTANRPLSRAGAPDYQARGAGVRGSGGCVCAACGGGGQTQQVKASRAEARREGGAGSLGDHRLVNETLSTTASRVLSPVPTVRTHQALSRGPSRFRHLLVCWAHSSPSHPTSICLT